MFVTEWSDEAGAYYDQHSHPHREARIVLCGGMTLTIGSTEFDLSPGDRIDLDAGERHSARVHSSGVKYLAGTAR